MQVEGSASDNDSDSSQAKPRKGKKAASESEIDSSDFDTQKRPSKQQPQKAATVYKTPMRNPVSYEDKADKKSA